MISLRKSCLRAVVSKKCAGQITVFMSLLFLLFLSLYFVCLESVHKQYQRKQAEQAVEAGMFSLFSEYEPHLLEQYDLFCLDTSFGGKVERMDEICSHLWKFTENNLTGDTGGSLYGLNLRGVDIKGMVRLTDGGGAAFYRQAVEIMKEKTGASLAEDWILQDLFQNDSQEHSRKFQEDCEAYEGSVRDYDEEEDDEDQKMNPEARQWDGLWSDFVWTKAIPDGYQVSERTIAAENTLSHREISVGAGKAGGMENQLLQKQWFIRYLSEYMKHAQGMLPDQRTGGWLDYQIEYIIAGKASDKENLDAVIGKLLLIREGMNYAFLLTHPELREKAEVLALALAGITGNEGVIKGLEQLILLSWAHGESLVEVRQLLGGSELAMMKSTKDWQVPLSELISVLNDPGRYDTQAHKQEGISYEMCLCMFLLLESAETLSMRTMDVIEGELRSQEGCGSLHLDHCVDYLTGQVWIEDIYLERSYGYE